MELGSLIRHSNMRLTLLIPSQIPTAPSLLSPKPIYTPMRTTRTVFPRSTLASVLPQTQIARMPRAPARTTFSTLFQRATSISTTSVLLRMIRSLQRPTCLTFKRAPFKTRLVLSSYTNNATMRRTRCLTEIVGLLQSCTCTVSCQLNNPQTHAATSLPSAQWCRAAFKFSSGQVMLVGTPSFRLRYPIHAHVVFSFAYARRLGLQHRWRAGRRRQHSIR